MGRISNIVKAMFVDTGLMKEQCWATREQDAYLCAFVHVQLNGATSFKLKFKIERERPGRHRIEWREVREQCMNVVVGKGRHESGFRFQNWAELYFRDHVMSAS